MARILLAEDDEDMRRFLERALNKAGHHVTSFSEGASAFEGLKNEPFDLLLTDIVMPIMDGIELARLAVDYAPHLKVMFITGFAAVALHPDSNAPKDARVLSKPFHLKDLVQEVERLSAMILPSEHPDLLEEGAPEDDQGSSFPQDPEDGSSLAQESHSPSSTEETHLKGSS